ncbi:MAG: amidohydrolase family protein [Pirellulales bacterium]|nr:amidohydrolase family protein [Pirellulales bacterium]
MPAYRAKWLVPVTTPPIENGVIAFAAGKISAIETAHCWSGETPVDLGDVAILPGLVNAHTHWEFSTLPAPLGQRGMPFTDWLRLVVKWRQSQTPMDRQQALMAGVRESLASGVTTVGEIDTQGWLTDQAFSARPVPDAVLFQEAICFSQTDVPAKITEISRRCGYDSVRHDHSLASRPGPADVWQPGVSPHAPYTVHADLLHELVRLSCLHQLPLAMHLAETPAELEFLHTGRGPLMEMLFGAGVWREDLRGSARTVHDLLQILATAPRALVVHGNYLGTAEIDLLAKNADHMSVVYCPRTHDFFGHAPHPWQIMQKEGVTVALGTDSRASNPDLSLWREMQWLAERNVAIEPEKILTMGTLEGAKALGKAGEIGSLEVAKRANMSVISGKAGKLSGWESLLYDPSARVAATCLRGDWL